MVDYIVTKRTNPLEKKLDTVIKFFDGEVLTLKKRVTRVEEKVGLTPIN